MPVFISYSHQDKDFVDRLAADLVRNRTHVWLDRWELNVGDSLILNIQKAMRDSDALLVVLSNASVESAWCQKELSVGLTRELKEKRVVVLPLLIEDCDIPPFLSDKLYADFRSDYSKGFDAVLGGISAVTNPRQSRTDTEYSVIDWAFEWGESPEGNYVVAATIADMNKLMPVTVITRMTTLYDKKATRRAYELRSNDLEWYEHRYIANELSDFGDKANPSVTIDDTLEHATVIPMKDRFGSIYRVALSSRRLGVDPGRPTLVKLGNYLNAIKAWHSTAERGLTPDEREIVEHVLKKVYKKRGS